MRFKTTLLLISVITACGTDSDPVIPPGTGPELVAVEFVYRAATVLDPAVQAQFPGCVGGVGQTHIHPSWQGFFRTSMTAVSAGEWRVSFRDVPTQQLNSIRISDPNVCAANPTGAATDSVFANGVLLSNVVDTPGTGVEPGLSFMVDMTGVITP